MIEKTIFANILQQLYWRNADHNIAKMMIFFVKKLSFQIKCDVIKLFFYYKQKKFKIEIYPQTA